MLQALFTLDYEIHGNGQGSPRDLVVDPTARLLRQFDRHGARLTIMADIGEILRFRRHAEETGHDDFAYGDIAEQLRTAVLKGHDVQFHIHPSFLNAVLVDGVWQQDYSEYDVADLGYERIDELLKLGRRFLEDLLRPADPSYRCLAFRAANWSMHPSSDIVRALVDNHFLLDSSVFKDGFRNGMVRFDYRDAQSALVPWPVDPRDVCHADPNGKLVEVPIYAESRHIQHFLTANRIYRAIQGRLHPLPSEGLPRRANSDSAVEGRPARTSIFKRLSKTVTSRHSWKLDFNQCSGRQLIAGVERAARCYDAPDRSLPIVLIGHSKIFTRLNERSLEPFLEHLAANPERFAFATFRSLVEHGFMTEPQSAMLPGPGVPR